MHIENIHFILTHTHIKSFMEEGTKDLSLDLKNLNILIGYAVSMYQLIVLHKKRQRLYY